MSVWVPSLSPRVGGRSAIYPSALKEERRREREAPFAEIQKEKSSPFFPAKVIPAGKTALSTRGVSTYSVHPSGYRSVRYRLSIEQRTTATPDSRFVCRKRSEFSRELFPPSSREHRHRRSRLTCCRITGSTLAACPFASYLSSSPSISPFSDHYSIPGTTDERNRMSHGETRRWNWSARKHLD